MLSFLFSLAFVASLFPVSFGQDVVKARFQKQGLEIPLMIQKDHDGSFLGMAFDLKISNTQEGTERLLVDHFFNQFLVFDNEQSKICQDDNSCQKKESFTGYQYPFGFPDFNLSDINGFKADYPQGYLPSFGLLFNFSEVLTGSVDSSEMNVSGIIGTIGYIYNATNLFSSMGNQNIVSFFISNPIDPSPYDQSHFLLGRVSSQYIAHNATKTIYAMDSINQYPVLSVSSLFVGDSEATLSTQYPLLFSLRDFGVYLPDELLASLKEKINELNCGSAAPCDFYNLSLVPSISFELPGDLNNTVRNITLDPLLYFDNQTQEFLLYPTSSSVYADSFSEEAVILGVTTLFKYYLAVDYQNNVFYISESSGYYKLPKIWWMATVGIILALMLFLFVIGLISSIVRESVEKKKII